MLLKKPAEVKTSVNRASIVVEVRPPEFNGRLSATPSPCQEPPLTLTSTPVGGSNEVIENGKNGWLIDLVNGVKPDPIDLSKIIVDVINSKDSRDEKMSNAKNLLNTKFDEEVNLLEYLKVFQQ